MTPIVVLVLVVAIAGAGFGALTRGWTDREAGRPTAAWIHVALPAALCGAAAWCFGLAWDLPAFVYLGAVSGPLTIVDLRAHRLPNQLTITAYPIVAALLLLAALVESDLESLGRAGVGALALFTLYLVLHLVNPSGMGLGDVKLAGPLGALLGWLGWSTLLVGGFLGFALGAVAGIALLLARRANRRTALPFGPFMLAGAWMAILLGDATTAVILP